MTPSSQWPLSYPTQKQVFSFLSIAPRRSLAVHCPQTRNWQKKLPFRFDNIEAVLVPREDFSFPDVINIDGVVWSFDIKYFDREKVIFPNRQTRTFECTMEGRWNALLEYYLNREGTQVHHFLINGVDVNFKWELDYKIWNMTIRSNSQMAKLNPIQYLFDRSLDKLDLDFNMADWDDDDFYDFEQGHIKSKEFKLDVAKFEDFSDFHVISDNCCLIEHEADHMKFVGRCGELMNGKYSIGSKYGCAFTDNSLSVGEIWRIVKQGLGESARVRFTDEVPGLYVPIDECKELFIHSKEHEFSPQSICPHVFYANVQESGKSDAYHQLSLKRKWDHWNHKRHELVHRMLTNLEVPIVKWWLGIDLASWSPQLIREHQNFDKLITINKTLMWLRHYHLLVLSVISQFIFFITASNPLSILVFVPFSIVFHYFCFRPFKTFQKSSLIICPPF